MTEPNFWKENFWSHESGTPPFLGHFWCFLSKSLYPVIKIFWNFIFTISSTLPNTAQKLNVQEKSGSSCYIQGTRPLFFILSHFFAIFGMLSHSVSSAVIWRICEKMTLWAIWVKIDRSIIFKFICHSFFVSYPVVEGIASLKDLWLGRIKKIERGMCTMHSAPRVGIN